MIDVRLTRDLLAGGYTYTELARQQRAGDLVRVRRGAYGSLDLTAATWERQEVQHRLLIESTVRLLGREAIVSHSSAALLHGLPVFASGLGRVHVTRPGSQGGKNRGHLSIHTARLDDTEIVSLNGMHRTLGEFDGRIKYGRLLKPGQSTEDVVYDEKRREDTVRDHGHQMARWVSADLKTPREIGRRVERAFARNASRR